MSTQLQQISTGLADVVAQTSPYIVRVEGRRRVPASGFVWSAEGHIITAHHVLRRQDGIQIGLDDGRRVNATLIGRDPTTDLALLQADEGDWTPLPTAAPDSLRVGQLVLALARPGRTVQATLGLLSAVAGSWRTRAGGLIDRYLQTDVLMYPGFSGGPLVNALGEVVGLNTSGLAQGVSLSLPVDTITRVVTALQAHGRIQRGYLGVSTQQVKLPAGVVDATGQKSGLLIVGLEPDTPAAEGGLLVGDIIVSLAGDPIKHHDDLLASLSSDRVGQEVEIGLVRGGVVAAEGVVIGARD
ncbi:MAG TPA: trypsin-like peptidase domain-containing protein [Anaerolineae bacterium]|nr:trypsin-like peptidase domain-containing protein [Anaerolineae bacterium]